MFDNENLLIRLYIDEDVHGNLGVALRQQGYDALTVNEAGNGGLSDSQQLALAAENNRVVFTFNAADFIALHFDYLTRKVTHSGIILSKQITIKETVSRLLFFLDRVTADEMRDSLFWLPPIQDE
jgi:predicted nuclease of predicted toxin-antitoxin system